MCNMTLHYTFLSTLIVSELFPLIQSLVGEKRGYRRGPYVIWRVQKDPTGPMERTLSRLWMPTRLGLRKSRPALHDSYKVPTKTASGKISSIYLINDLRHSRHLNLSNLGKPCTAHLRHDYKRTKVIIQIYMDLEGRQRNFPHDNKSRQIFHSFF